ncbi:MAG: hypothetical protein AB8B95_15105 [Pseudohongiellaceae bacterium]
MRTLKTIIMASLLSISALVTLNVSAQSADNARFLSLAPPGGLPIIPVFEGWTAHPDGSTSYSFGFINRNSEGPTDLPLGDMNFIEPAEYNGLQPTHFPSGRTTGAFTVTIPPEAKGTDVWWNLKPADGGDVLRVPGRATSGAYELDFVRPRPQGALQPLAGFGTNGEPKAGLLAQVGELNETVKAGQPVVLTINATDPSDRDPSDPRFTKPLPMGVEFNKHQGPGDVTFTRHESTKIPTNPYKETNRRFRFWTAPDENALTIDDTSGVARVVATFSEPGEYMIRTTVDNFRAPDSQQGDQCCWTNILQKVTVTP